LNFTRGLARIPEIDLHVICCQQDVPVDTVVERDGATIHFLRHHLRLTQLINLLPLRRKMARVVRNIQPDLAHAQGLGIPAAGALDTDLPCLISIHGIIWKEPSDHPSWITRLGDRLRRREAYRQVLQARNLVLSSHYVAKVLPPKGNYRRFIINNPVGDEIFRIRNQPQSPHILVVGGLRRRKDPLTSVRVMAQVIRQVPDATMHILGVCSGTALEDTVADFILRNRLGDHIKILGLVPNEQLWQEYERASVLLMPSLEETAPVALAEACAVGIPQVGTDAGGIPYMIQEGETGFVRPIGNVAALAERVEALLLDTDLHRRLAQNAKELGRREFTLDTIAKQTYGVYCDLLGG
jgi:glycosyltransferase involved in cell wall biosynthesis